MTSPILSLICETASIQRDIEAGMESARRRGLNVPDSNGDAWRRLAACSREYRVLKGKADLADEVANGGTCAGEFMRTWNALEKEKNV